MLWPAPVWDTYNKKGTFYNDVGAESLTEAIFVHRSLKYTQKSYADRPRLLTGRMKTLFEQQTGNVSREHPDTNIGPGRGNVCRVLMFQDFTVAVSTQANL